MDLPYSFNISLGFHYVWSFYFTTVPTVPYVLSAMNCSWPVDFPMEKTVGSGIMGKIITL